MPRNDFGYLDWNIYFQEECNYLNDAWKDVNFFDT